MGLLVAFAVRVLQQYLTGDTDTPPSLWKDVQQIPGLIIGIVQHIPGLKTATSPGETWLHCGLEDVTSSTTAPAHPSTCPFASALL